MNYQICIYIYVFYNKYLNLKKNTNTNKSYINFFVKEPGSLNSLRRANPVGRLQFNGAAIWTTRALPNSKNSIHKNRRTSWTRKNRPTLFSDQVASLSESRLLAVRRVAAANSYQGNHRRQRSSRKCIIQVKVFFKKSRYGFHGSRNLEAQITFEVYFPPWN